MLRAQRRSEHRFQRNIRLIRCVDRRQSALHTLRVRTHDTAYMQRITCGAGRADESSTAAATTDFEDPITWPGRDTLFYRYADLQPHQEHNLIHIGHIDS